MNYLAIDTSGKHITVVICNQDKIYSYFDEECGVNHSVNLMPRIEELAQKADFDFKKADFFACVVGAGSFTGIRIGVATVKAMCFAFSKPSLSITSFDTLAYNVDGSVLAVIDAKHNGFYVCGYDNGHVNFEPSYIMREQMQELAKKYDTVVCSTNIEGMAVKKVNVNDGLIKAVKAKHCLINDDIETLTPLYVRKSQAEEGR